MNEDLILDEQNVEDLDKIFGEEISEEVSQSNELDMDIPEVEEQETAAESLDESIANIANLEDILQEYEPDNILNSSDEEELSNLDEDTFEDEEVKAAEEESTIEEINSSLENESVQEDDTVILEEPNEEIDEPTVEDTEEETVQEINTDENIITNDLNNIKIEFGIEAKGFILSITMMEVMIQKGYIFKDILNDKIFDAVMIFNGNLENTDMTNDIKIKIENGKIQLIKA